MNDVYYLKAGSFSSGLNRVKKSLILNARILYFIWCHHYLRNVTSLFGFISKHSIKFFKQTRVLLPSHYLFKFPFW